MIARHWTGLSKRERADEYIAHLENDTFKTLTSIAGFLQATILKRDTDEGVEFLITTHWDSIESIKGFAGSDVDTAVVPELVQGIMIRYDKKVRHYQIHTVI